MAKKKKVKKVRAKQVRRVAKKSKPKVRRRKVPVAPKRPQRKVVAPVALVVKEKRSLLPFVVILLIILLTVLLPLGLSQKDEAPKQRIQRQEIQINSLDLKDSRMDQINSAKESDEAKAELHKSHLEQRVHHEHSSKSKSVDSNLEEVGQAESDCEDESETDTVQNIQIIN